MTQPGVLERIATALETIAAALVGEAPAPRAPRRPDAEDAHFGWDPDAEHSPAVPLPEPEPPVERCGFLIERFVHPLDRVTVVHQISKAGATLLVDAGEAARLAELDDAGFTATMAPRLAEVLAQRHREARAAAPEPADAVEAPVSRLAPDASDEEREREWAATLGSSE